MEGAVAVLVLGAITVVSVLGFAWGMTRKIDAQRDIEVEKKERAQRSALALRIRLRGRDLLRSLRNRG